MTIKPGFFNIFFKRYNFEMLNNYLLEIKAKQIYKSEIKI